MADIRPFQMFYTDDDYGQIKQLSFDFAKVVERIFMLKIGLNF